MFIIKYTLFEAYKRKLWLIYLLAVIACIAVAYYTRSISITEGQQSFIIFYSAFIRLSLVFIISFYLLNTESRLLEESRIQLLLSLPITRHKYLLGKLIAYGLISFVFIVIASIPLLGNSEAIFVIAWCLALFAELYVIVAAALLLVTLFQQPIFSMSIMCFFYLFARSASNFHNHADYLITENAKQLDIFLAWPLMLISYLVPKLDQYADVSRIIYPEAGMASLFTILTQALIYTGLLAFLALSQMRRKEF